MDAIESHEKAKEHLKREILLALRLENLENGRHILRDDKNWLIGEFWVEGVWLAFIEPSFDPYSALAVIHEKDTSAELSICLHDSHILDYLNVWKKYLPSSTL